MAHALHAMWLKQDDETRECNRAPSPPHCVTKWKDVANDTSILVDVE